MNPQTIVVWVNGEQRTLTAGTSVGALVDAHALDRRTVLAELNGEVLWPRTWDESLLSPNDRLELLRVSAGG